MKNELENIHEISNRELLLMLQQRIRRYEYSLMKFEGDIDTIMFEIEQIKDEILSRMYTPPVIKLKVK